jgi:quinol monooxygenase YgiN
MSKLAVIACITLTEDSAPRYVEAARAVIEPTRAEPGCERYAMGVDITDPTKVWVSEQWASQAALNDHLQTAHVQAFLAQLAELEIVDIDARQYEVSSVGPVVMPE